MFETLAKNDRLIVSLGLVFVTALSWAYILAGAGMDMGMDMGRTMPMGTIGDMKLPMPSASWTLAYAALMLAMWWVMMAAMMLPGAAPMVLLFATVNRSAALQSGRAVPTIAFVSGYLVVWGVFSLAAAIAQFALTSAGILDGMMRGNSPWFAGLVLIAAGVYQMTPIKDTCLRHCQSPQKFVMRHWQPGPAGAFRMGLAHGTFCLGCCGAMMVLLFIGGVMNILWIGGLALFVLIEKHAGRWPHFNKVTGAALVTWGGILLGQASGLG